jgi:hypothetical protein
VTTDAPADGDPVGHPFIDPVIGHHRISPEVPGFKGQGSPTRKRISSGDAASLELSFS